MNINEQSVSKITKLPNPLERMQARLNPPDKQFNHPTFDNTEIDNDKARKLLVLWRCRAHKAAKAHYRATLESRLLNRILTILNAVASILILFMTNSEWVNKYLDDKNGQIIAQTAKMALDGSDVTISLAAVFLVLTTILQYIVRWGEKANDHKAAGAEFANLQRKIERYSIAKTYNMSMIHNINRTYNHISKSYPLVSAKKWQEAGKGHLNDMISQLENELQEESLITLA